MKKYLILIIGLIIFSGCNEPLPDEMPDDFRFSYSNGAMHLDWGSYNFTCDEEGKAEFTKEINGDVRKTYEFQVSEEDREKVYKSVVENNFFGLQDTYEDPTIMDGGFSKISVYADGQRKTVDVSNFYQPQFENVETAINQIIKKYVGDDAYSFNDLKSECSNKQIACIGNEMDYECDSWRAFCDWEENVITDTDDFVATAGNCEALENREKCITYCSTHLCEEEICDTLVFDAEQCTGCGTGCCSFCNDLDSCTATDGCYITWVHPSGESWQYGGCENMNLCMSTGTLCNYILTSYQGFLYHSVIEEDITKATLYEQLGNALQDTYNSECSE
ncbi:MAG: hypothetical protein V1672_04140 [Candidatus Diapherotrites archaeon]